MSTDIDIRGTEWGVLRVFAVNETAEDRARWASDATAQGAAEEALGAPGLDPAHVDVLDLDALRELGLSTYLIDGMGLPEDRVAPDRARLDALSGHAVVVSSAAFGGRDLTLRPGPALTLIGTYRPPGPEPSFEPLSSESATGVAGTGPQNVPAGKPGRALLILALAVVAVVVLVLTFAGGDG